MAFEDRLKEARKKENLTQEQAAQKIGIKKSTWAGYESGNSQPDIQKIIKIMEILNVDANYLWQDYKKTPDERELSEEAIKIAECFDNASEDGRSLLKHVAEYIDKANDSSSHHLGGFPEAVEIYSALAEQTYSQQDIPAARQK